MAKPYIIANGGSPGVKASVSAGSTVNFTLDSIVGVVSVQWYVVTTDETSAIGDYTLTQSGSRGQNMSLTALGAGTAAIVGVKINSGLVRGLIDLENTTNTIKFFVPTAEGLEVGAAGETYESDATTGNTEILNAPIRLLNSFTTSLYEGDVKRAFASETANVALTGDPSPMDGQAISTGDVVLLLGQTAPKENGLWEVDTSGAWARPANFTTAAAVQGAIVVVIAGSARGGFIYQNTNTNDPTIGSDTLVFTRITDRFDRTDLNAASASPAPTILTRYGSASELNASYLTSNGTNPAASGFVRAVKNVVGLAFRNDGNTADLEAVSMDGTDTIRVGSTLAEGVSLGVKTAGMVTCTDNGTEFLQFKSNDGMRFGRSATATIYQEEAGSGSGANLTVQAQQGSASNNGGNLVLLAGPGGSGGTDGEITIGRTTDTVRVRSNTSFFGTNQFGSGDGVISIHEASTAPTTNPTGAGILYVDTGGVLKWRQPDGTITQIAPSAAATSVIPYHFALSISGTSSTAAWVPTGGYPAVGTQSTIYPFPIGFDMEIYRIDVSVQAAGTTGSSGALRYSIWIGESGSAIDSGEYHDHDITLLTSGSDLINPVAFTAGDVLSMKQAAVGSVTGGAVRVVVTALARLT